MNCPIASPYVPIPIMADLLERNSPRDLVNGQFSSAVYRASSGGKRLMLGFNRDLDRIYPPQSIMTFTLLPDFGG